MTAAVVRPPEPAARPRWVVAAVASPRVGPGPATVTGKTAAAATSRAPLAAAAERAALSAARVAPERGKAVQAVPMKAQPNWWAAMAGWGPGLGGSGGTGQGGAGGTNEGAAQLVGGNGGMGTGTGGNGANANTGPLTITYAGTTNGAGGAGR